MKDNKWLNKDEWDFHKEYMNKLITKEKVIVNTDLAEEHIKSKESIVIIKPMSLIDNKISMTVVVIDYSKINKNK